MRTEPVFTGVKLIVFWLPMVVPLAAVSQSEPLRYDAEGLHFAAVLLQYDLLNRSGLSKRQAQPEPLLELLASQRVSALPSLAMTGLRELLERAEALAVAVRARFTRSRT